MMKRFLLLLTAAVCGLALFAACGKGPDAFISFKVPSESPSAKLGMSRDDIYSKLLVGGAYGWSERDAGLALKWSDNTYSNCVALIDSSTYIELASGLTLDNAMTDVLPKYQKDPNVKILSSDPTKIVLGEQIGGVNYAIAVRGYGDGSIKYITVYNADLYTDSDDNYQ